MMELDFEQKVGKHFGRPHTSKTGSTLASASAFPSQATREKERVPLARNPQRDAAIFENSNVFSTLFLLLEPRRLCSGSRDPRSLVEISADALSSPPPSPSSSCSKLASQPRGEMITPNSLVTLSL